MTSGATKISRSEQSIRFPNLFIIGAMKAGTSSLHEYLRQHPDIFMSRFKEPQYFAPHRIRYGMWGQGNPLPEPGIDWYLRLFEDAANARYAGESSVSYSARHWVSGCEQRIREFNPQARIIYLMRDPVERAISHYWHFVAAGRETLSPEAAMRRRDDYIARSDYAYQIEPYLRCFGENRVYLMTTEELESDGAEACRELFRWLEVDDAAPIDASRRFNVTKEGLEQTRRGFRRLRSFMEGHRWRRIEQYLPRSLASAVRRSTCRRVDRSTVNLEPARSYLRKQLGPTVLKLMKLVGREFPEWRMLETEDASGKGELREYQSQIDCCA